MALTCSLLQRGFFGLLLSKSFGMNIRSLCFTPSSMDKRRSLLVYVLAWKVRVDCRSSRWKLFSAEGLPITIYFSCLCVELRFESTPQYLFVCSVSSEIFRENFLMEECGNSELKFLRRLENGLK
ncbi:hypothetical protein Tco_0328968 [Tanacetum coccineum]|uniref:Uncharacterized protein n=1 Tax=Tanacetum coccineum TaxID=301880 RepID=A0ABQ4YL18_9ASTR